MDFKKPANSVVHEATHFQGLQEAHTALQKSLLSSLPWSSDDFYSAMAVYRKVVGIEFRNDDDAMLDKWLDGADAAWKEEIKSKGDNISLAGALEKAIVGGMRAVGVRFTAKTPGVSQANRRWSEDSSRTERETSLKTVRAED